MPTERRRIECLRDIVKYCDQIEAFLRGFTREAFDADLRTQNAVLYSLQTVGEAAIRLDKEEKRQSEPGLMENRYSHIPWRDVRGLSNVVRHGYDDIDLDIVWTTATEGIRPVRDAANREIARARTVNDQSE
jgi:uncharacterized protein with HEPN domain